MLHLRHKDEPFVGLSGEDLFGYIDALQKFRTRELCISDNEHHGCPGNRELFTTTDRAICPGSKGLFVPVLEPGFGCRDKSPPGW